MRTDDLSILLRNPKHIKTFCGGFNQTLAGILCSGQEISEYDFDFEDGYVKAEIHGEPLFEDDYPPQAIQFFLNQLAGNLPEADCTLVYEAGSYSCSDDCYEVRFVCRNGTVSCEGMDGEAFDL